MILHVQHNTAIVLHISLARKTKLKPGNVLPFRRTHRHSATPLDSISMQWRL